MPRKLKAMENGPATGMRTSASGNSRLSRCPTANTIGMRPSCRGLNGLSKSPSSSEFSKGL